jgi:hypothetical protein
MPNSSLAAARARLTISGVGLEATSTSSSNSPDDLLCSLTMYLLSAARPPLCLKRVMNLGENRIEMRIPRSAWFLRDLRFPHS